MSSQSLSKKNNSRISKKSHSSLSLNSFKKGLEIVATKYLFGEMELRKSELPWRRLRSMKEVAQNMPSFVIVELLYRTGSLLCLYHALMTGNLRLFLSSFLCGTANDVFFMVLPFCDNFWQAQAMIMLTPRLPLYIVEMYATVIYLSTTASRSLHLSLIPEATSTGLLAWLFYHVYDVNGANFLWWTWHDADLAISKRQYGAPIGSALWILTYISLHALLFRFTDIQDDDVSIFMNAGSQQLAHASFANHYTALIAEWVLAGVNNLIIFQDWIKTGSYFLVGCKGIAFTAALCTPLFMVLMGMFQLYSFDTIGIPGNRILSLALVVFVIASSLGVFFRPKFEGEPAGLNSLLLAYIFFFYAVNIFISSHFKSEDHYSTGIHQKYSDTSQAVVDVMRFKREDHIQSEGPILFSKNDYRLATAQDLKRKLDLVLPEPKGVHSVWYTIVGKPKSDSRRQGNTRRVILFAVIGSCLYSIFLLQLV